MTTIDESWSQGRGAFGGLIAASVVRACEAVAGEVGALRSLHVHMCAPMTAGEARMFAKVERRGVALSFVSCRVLQRGRVVAFGGASIGADRSDLLDASTVAMPDMASADVTPVLGEVPLMPPFARQYLEYRPAWGPPALSSGPVAEGGGWIRLREPSPLDAAMAVALLDAWPPAVYSRVSTPHVMGTTALALHVVGDLPPAGLAVDTPWGVTVHSHHVHSGFCDEVNRLWTPDGRLLAVVRQVVTLVR